MGGWRDRQAEEMYGGEMTNVPQLFVGYIPKKAPAICFQVSFSRVQRSFPATSSSCYPIIISCQLTQCCLPVTFLKLQMMMNEV
jgi:hypothetical protein